MIKVVSQAQLDAIASNTAAGFGSPGAPGSIGLLYQVRDTGEVFTWDPTNLIMRPAGAASSWQVQVASTMTSRVQTRVLQAALDAARLAGGGTVEVLATPGMTITLDDMLRIGSKTRLRVPEHLRITRGNHSKNVPSLGVTINTGAITAVAVNSQPGGYREAPQVFFTGSQLEPAEVYAFIDNSTKVVTKVHIKNGGRGYYTAPTSVTFKGKARSDLSGSSLSRNPTISLSVSGGAVTGYTIVDAGANLAYGGWVPLRVKGGMHARATASISASGALSAITMTQGGANYMTLRTYQTLGSTTVAHCVGGHPNLLAPLITNHDWHNGNEDIAIEGGIWDGNVDGVDYAFTVDEFSGMGMLFISCDNVVLKPNVLQNMHRYAVHLIDCWNSRVAKHACYNGFDDVHLTGPARWIQIEGMTGSTGDDMYTCTALERDVVDFLAGPQQFIEVSNVEPQGTSFLLACWGGIRPDGTYYEMDDIHCHTVRGMTCNQLFRVNNVEALAYGGIKKLRFTDIQLRGQETFSDGGTVTPPNRSLGIVYYATVDRLEVQVKHYLGSSGNTITPTVLEFNNSGTCRELIADLDLDWNCAATAQIVYFTSGAGAAPETVKVTGSVQCGAESANTIYILYFNGSTKCPTRMTDISGLRAKGISLVNGLTATNNYLRAIGTQLYKTTSTSGAIAYAGILNATFIGCIFDGGHKVCVSSAGADTLNWYGSGNQMLGGTAPHSSTTASFYPRDLSLTVSLTHTANNNKIAKATGVQFVANGTTNYGIKNTGICMVSPDYDGTNWFTMVGDGCRAMDATIVAGGTGHAVNDLLTVSSGTWRSPPVIKVTAVSGGVVTAVTVDYSGLWDKARSTGTLTTTSSGAGTGATFTLAPH